MADTARVQAIYRPRSEDVRIIRRDGESFDIPASDADELARALRDAVAIPGHAEALCRETAWSAR
jgi:hypothetical protein